MRYGVFGYVFGEFRRILKRFFFENRVFGECEMFMSFLGLKYVFFCHNERENWLFVSKKAFLGTIFV